MSEYAARALFIYEPEAEALLEACRDNEQGTEIQPVPLPEFLQNPAAADGCDHLVVSASLDGIKEVLRFAADANLGVGIAPLPDQARLRRYLDLPRSTDEVLELALRGDPGPMDLATCNGEIVLFKAVIGWLPVLDAADDLGRLDMIRRLFQRWVRLRLYPYRITTANGKSIKTAATGCMVVERHQGDLVSRLIGEDLSIRDGKVALVVASPFSMVEYIRFLYQLFSRLKRKSGLPSSVAYIQSRGLHIESDKEKEVYIDGQLASTTPVEIAVAPSAVKVNLGPALMSAQEASDIEKEIVRTESLRSEEELSRSIGKRVPFFSYASEEHFKELFTALAQDSRVNDHYLVFSVLSAFLATLGLYLNSAAVIIGAMILAPLMSPLVSLAMGLLRASEGLFRHSLEKLGVGVALVLVASALTSMVFPFEPVTREMSARLQPSLPDLFVAIFAGIAAAYARSYREIAQSLAGVAIAVALVPPLAVAGIGIGRADPGFFGQAFLLFFTNLVGIVLAATVTFRVLGFSPALQAKRRLGVMALLLILILVPLGLSSMQIARRWEVELMLEARLLVISDGEVSVTEVETEVTDGEMGIVVTVAVEKPLQAADFEALRREIRAQLGDELRIRLQQHYLL